MQRKAPRIRIASLENSGRYVAVFASEVLDATFLVVFRETVTGAVALHSFAEMIRSRYEVSPELTVVDTLPRNPAVAEVLRTIDDPAFSRLSRS